MIKAIIFDMNGVIIDDEHAHEMAFRDTVKEYKIDLTHDDYLACCAGKTDRRGYEDIAKKFQQDLPVDTLLDRKWKIYPQLFEKHKKAFEGVVELIRDLSQKYTIALASSASRDEVILITKEFDVEKYFSVMISANDVVNGKPHPEPYLKTAELLHVSPVSCAVIEDSPSGVRAAKSAGCYCIAITTTHTKEDLREADVIVGSFADIDDVLINKLGV
ncbi:MAG: HAD family phosphatase [Parcubacteria group bacterium]|jgi:HAD superfamily hydrolase (TIGR01509 family)